MAPGSYGAYDLHNDRPRASARQPPRDGDSCGGAGAGAASAFLGTLRGGLRLVVLTTDPELGLVGGQTVPDVPRMFARLATAAKPIPRTLRTNGGASPASRGRGEGQAAAPLRGAPRNPPGECHAEPSAGTRTERCRSRCPRPRERASDGPLRHADRHARERQPHASADQAAREGSATTERHADEDVRHRLVPGAHAQRRPQPSNVAEAREREDRGADTDAVVRGLRHHAALQADRALVLGADARSSPLAPPGRSGRPAARRRQ